MAIKFLSGLNLDNVTSGSILKLDSNGNIVAATAGTDYATSNTWSTASSSNIYYSAGDVRIGTYQASVDAAARLHVFDYQTTDPKLLIEDGNTGDASMQFKISTQSYTMGIDNSDSDKFVLAASSALGTTNVLEISTAGATAFQEGVLFNEDVTFANDVNFNASGYNFTISSDTTTRTTLAWRIDSVDSWAIETNADKDLTFKKNTLNTTGDFQIHSLTRITNSLTVNTNSYTNTITAGHSGALNLIDVKTLILDDSFGTNDGRVFGVLQPAPFKPSDIILSDSSVASDALSNSVTNTFPNVKGEADATGITNSATFTFAEALAQAETLGGRLPTLEEVLNGVGNGSGQGYDSEYIWTQTKAGHGKYWVAKGHGISYNDAKVVDINDSTPPEYRMRIFYDISKDNMPVYYDNSSNIRATSIKAENSDGIALRALDGDIGITVTDDGNVKFNQYTAGLLKTDSVGNISLDTNTYLTSVSVDWSDIASINGTININSTTQIGEGDTETLVSFQNSGTERGSFQVDSSANSYFVATGFKTSTASTGFLKADGTVDTGDFFSGSYSDLTGTPTLGTMAAANTSDYKDSDTVESYVAQELGSYTTTSSFGTNAFTSYTDHSTQGYLTSYTETDTLDSVTGRGATTTNNISVGNLSAVGGTFTDPVTIYDSTTTENPRLSVGRNSGESIQFNVTDVVNTITAKQDSDSDGDHFFVLDRVFAGSGDSIFRINNDGTPDLTIDGNGVVTLNQYGTAGILQINTSGTISVDTNTYSTATGVADNADAYGSWTVSDGTNTENVTSGTTVAWRGSGATSVSYDASTNQFNISSTNTEYSNATTSVSGLMSSTDKTKLNSVATNADVTPSWVPANDPSYLTSIPSEYLTQTEGDARYVSYESLARAVPSEGGWYRLAKLSRGGARFAISYTGGSMSPHTYIIDAFKNWNNEATISVEKFGHANYITGFRISRRIGAGNNDYYLEANFTSLSATHSFEARYQEVLGYTSISEIYSVSSSSTLVASDSDDSERIEQVTTTTAEGLYLQNINLDGRLNLYTDSNTTSTTALVLNGTEVEKRTLGSNAFTSTSYAPLASPALTGTPTAPTAGSTTNTTQIATTAFVQTAVSNLVDSAPGTLDTLNELAAALGDDADFSTTVTNSIATKLPLAGGTLTGTLRLPWKWSSTDLTANSFYVKGNSDQDGFAFGVGTGVSTWFSWDNVAGQKRAIDVWNDGSKILLGAEGHNTEISNDLYVPSRIYHTGDTDTYMQFHAGDQWRVVTGGTERLEVNNTATTVANTLTASGGINGLTLANGGISGTNYNITGVNQLEIADPGEGIVFKSGSSGDMTLAIVDDTSDNILRFSGTGATFDVAGALTSTNLTIADAIYHEGDTNTSISFGTDTINLNTGGGVRASISDSGAKFNNNTIIAGGATLSLGERAEGDDNGRTVLIEGAANASSGEGAGRIFFTEHNSTDAAADSYGLSLYYEGDPNIALPSGFQPNTGNATWSLRRHDNSVNGVAIMSGSRTSNNVLFSGTVTVGGALNIPEYIYHNGDTNTYVRFTGDRIRIVAGGSTKFDSNNTYLLDVTPAAPSVTAANIVGETIEVVFDASTTADIDYYQVWSSVNNGSYGMIAQIPDTDFASTMTVVDAAFEVSGDITYRVYAVKSGIYSTPGTVSATFTASSLEVTNMSVVSLNTAYYIQYDMPNSRFVDNVEIYMDAEAASGDLSRTGATLIYSGSNTSYMYQIGASDLDKFHQFWVEVIES